MELHSEHNEGTERILSSLDGIQRAEPAPFFYTRLRARMKEDTPPQSSASVLQLRPALLAASLLLVLMLNIFFLVKPASKINTETQKPRLNGIQAFAESYNLDNTSALYE